MASDHTCEFLVLLDRYLAGDLSNEEEARLHELREQNGAFELEFARHERFENLLSETLRTCALQPVDFARRAFDTEEFVSHPDFLMPHDDEAASDASGIDLLAAGLLSQEDEATLRLDTSSDVWLIDELRDADLLADLLKDTLRQVAGDGPSQTFVGADRIDRYLAGDLSIDEVAQLMADADEHTTLGVELSDARSFESMMRGALCASAAGELLPAGSDSTVTPWIGACEERFERYLAGDLSASEVAQLEAAATNAPAIASRLQSARNFESLMFSAFQTMTEPVAASALHAAPVGGLPVPAPSRRLRARHFLRQRRVRRQRQAAVIATSLVAVLVIALLFAFVPRGNDDGGGDAGFEERVAVAAPGPDEEKTSTPSTSDANTLETDASANTSEPNAVVAPNEERTPTDVELILPEAHHGDSIDDAGSDNTPSKGLADPIKASDGSDEPSETDSPDEGPDGPIETPAKPDTINDEGGRTSPRPDRRAWYDTLSFVLPPQMVEERKEMLASIEAELLSIVGKNAEFDEENLLPAGEDEDNASYRRRHRPLRHLSATYAIVVRAMLRADADQGEWKNARKDLKPAVDALLDLWKRESDAKNTSLWDDAEVLSTIEVWYRTNEEAGKYQPFKVGHRRLISDALLSIVERQQSNGMWGEASASHYGALSREGSLAHWVGREITSDLYNTFAALRGIEAGTKLLRSQVADSVYEKLADAILRTQSNIGQEVEFTRVRLDINGKTIITPVRTTARGWTMTGDNENAETGRPLMRTGAMTAAALFMLKVCQSHLSSGAIERIEARLEGATFAKAELDAVAWLDAYHRSDANPASNDKRQLAGYDNFRFLYLYAMRKAFDKTGDVGLKERAFNRELCNSSIESIDAFEKIKWDVRESLVNGPINGPIRRAFALLALTGE